MKIVRRILEALKLYSLSCLIIGASLVFVLILAAYNADRFVVPINYSSSNRGLLLPNLTVQHGSDFSEPLDDIRKPVEPKKEQVHSEPIEPKKAQIDSKPLEKIRNPVEPKKEEIYSEPSEKIRRQFEPKKEQNDSETSEKIQNPVEPKKEQNNSETSKKIRKPVEAEKEKINSEPSEIRNPVEPNKEQIKNITSNEKVQEKCNIFEGKWVYDPENSPLYNSAQCPFLGEQVSCQRNGRPDSEYEKWTWQPKGCDIPRRNIGKQMLEMLRNKRLIIAGDSLNRNQWESMACLLYTGLASPSDGLLVDRTSYKAFKSKRYNCSMEFYWCPFLVDFVVNPKSGERILKLDKLVPTSKKWEGADFMVFNTGHWWSHQGKYQSWEGFHAKGDAVETEKALSLALDTWSRWIEKNVDSAKTRVFFRSISPEHKGKTWCYNQTQPITDDSGLGKSPWRLTQVVERKIGEMKTPVTYLNITGLSLYRKDSHPGIYKNAQGKSLVAKNETSPGIFADCSHWCVPGVPDTWNWLIFASVFLESSKAVTFS